MKLKNKNVLITGGSRGIGKAIAHLFAQEGANIIIHSHYYDQEEDDLMNEIKEKYGVKVLCLEADMMNLEEIKKMVNKAFKSFSTIDILVNNSGVYTENEFLDSTEKSWNRVINTNLKGTYFCTQFVFKKMLKQKSGNIINVVSVAGLYPRKGHFEYAISKAGLIHFTKCLALIAAPKIRVNAIAPSYTWTGFMSFMNDKKKVQKRMKLIPLQKFNDPEDVAQAALFLASADSSKITGQILPIDGGRGAQI